MPRYSSRGYRRSTVRTVRGYTLRARNGRIRYVGVTNNPGRRASEHKSAGKTGRMKVETRGMPRSSARRWEVRKLAAYRRSHHRKSPPLNKTRTGGWKY